MNGMQAGPSSTRRPPREQRDHADLLLAARTDASILLTGRPDTARQLAYRLHLAGGWRHGAFTVVDCASGNPAIETLLVEALFDDQRAVPGVVQLRLVQAGTVLLQEVNALPLAIQRRLAAWLSEQSAPAQGRSRRRIIASSSEALLPRVLAGTFDDSLYYRLNVMHFVVPEVAP